MNRSGLGRTLRGERFNATLTWGLVAFIGLVALVNAGTDPLWSGFAALVVVISVIPAVALRSPRAMLPWEVLVLAALPVVVRALGIPALNDIATYLSVAAVALIIAVELHVFTAVDMNYSFAILFVIVSTMAAAGVWAVVRWSADIYLGVNFTLENRALMLEFVASTVAGIIAGIVFEVYFRRIARDKPRLEGEL